MSSFNIGRVTDIELSEGGRIPTRSYQGDAGWDLYTSEDGDIEPGQTVDVPTGIKVALPYGFWGHIVGRSSTIRNYGLSVLPGVIDNGYRGHLFISVQNTTNARVHVEKGARLAQLVPHKIVDLSWNVVTGLDKSERGEAGFGSSGR